MLEMLLCQLNLFGVVCHVALVVVAVVVTVAAVVVTGGDGGVGARLRAPQEGLIARWEAQKKKHNKNELSIGSPMRSMKTLWTQVRECCSCSRIQL